MADQNTQDQGTQGQVQDQNGAGGDTTPAKLYPTRAEAEAAKPADATKSLRVFEVAKAGASLGFMLGRGYDPCLAALARKDGYTVSLGNSAPVTKEAVAAKLAEFSDDELAAMGLSRKPAKGARK
jgi:hypothetical protein